MSLAELLLIALVAVVVFGPKQLPMLAEHLGMAIKRLTALKTQAAEHWSLLEKEALLKENERKAQEADATYQHKQDVDGSKL